MIRKDDRKIAGILMVGLWMMGIAVVAIVLSVVSLYFFMIGIPLFLVGLAVSGFAVFRGLHIEKKGASASTAYQVPDCLVIARFAINPIGETVFSEYDIFFDDPAFKYLVQLQPSEGRKMELRTNPEVWQHCGEGMRGTAVVQGDWLGAFSPTLGSGHGVPHPRD